MIINFVTETEKQRWILRYLAESLSTHIRGSRVSARIDNQAHCNVFVNYALYVKTNTKTAAIFTHREPHEPLSKHFDNVAKKVDWCFAMCRKTASMLPGGKTSILQMYPLGQYYKKHLVLGVVGRSYDSGRKRLKWMDGLKAISGVTVKLSGGDIPMSKMPDFYRSIDYLVVLAENEGGPMSVVEALAMGVPVIAPDVGFCWEFPVLRYTTKRSLLHLVRGLVIPRNGWKMSAEQLENRCQRL